MNKMDNHNESPRRSVEQIDELLNSTLGHLVGSISQIYASLSATGKISKVEVGVRPHPYDTDGVISQVPGIVVEHNRLPDRYWKEWFLLSDVGLVSASSLFCLNPQTGIMEGYPDLEYQRLAERADWFRLAVRCASELAQLAG